MHISTWLRFFIGNRLGPYHAMPQHVIDGMLNLADGPTLTLQPYIRDWARVVRLTDIRLLSLLPVLASVERRRAVRLGMWRWAAAD